MSIDLFPRHSKEVCIVHAANLLLYKENHSLGEWSKRSLVAMM